MIYIVTPSREDYKRFRDAKYSQSVDEIRWVSSFDHLMGLKLYKGDHFDVAPAFHSFDENTKERIYAEIQILHALAEKYPRPQRIEGAQYLATLPEGYEWKFITLVGHLRIIGLPKEGNKIMMYRLNGLTLVPEKIDVTFPEDTEL